MISGLRKRLLKQLIPPREGLVLDPVKRRWIRREPRQASLAEHLESRGFSREGYTPKVSEHLFKRPRQTLAEYLESRGFHEKSDVQKAFNDFINKEWWEKDTRMPAQGEPAKAEEKNGFYRLKQDPGNANYNARGMRPRTAVEQMRESK